ncbi:MAG: kynureninase [Planctomycetota bacterium]|jgi:kynureninase|nr:kynureninase [Blastopirellula sp.]
MAASLTSQARELDATDPLSAFREQFHIPRTEDGREQIYFVGNSLGLQPRLTAEYVALELEAWRTRGVRGHFSGAHPWMPYHEFLTEPMARIVGGLPSEVVVMNSLTANLHLMLATFFRPQGRRNKILIESGAFPSDHIAVESQLRWHGLSPEEHLLTGAPRTGEVCLSMDQWCELIERHREELAVIMLPGVQYYTGQVFDFARLTKLAHSHGITIGFDLAHAAGNVELRLHEWDVDFAVWCTYKYLNSGPGSVGGCFVHQRHATNTELGRLAGWWGHDKATRFLMRPEFKPIPTAEGWQLSNPPILSLAAIRASLEIFDRAGGMAPLIAKSRRLTGWFAALIREHLGDSFEILTPAERGCQLSLRSHNPRLPGKVVKQQLDAAGFETDWREPDVIRAAPVPLYNRFSDVAAFVEHLTRLRAGEA